MPLLERLLIGYGGCLGRVFRTSHHELETRLAQPCWSRPLILGRYSGLALRSIHCCLVPEDLFVEVQDVQTLPVGELVESGAIFLVGDQGHSLVKDHWDAVVDQEATERYSFNAFTNDLNWLSSHRGDDQPLVSDRMKRMRGRDSTKLAPDLVHCS